MVTYTRGFIQEDMKGNKTGKVIMCFPRMLSKKEIDLLNEAICTYVDKKEFE